MKVFVLSVLSALFMLSCSMSASKNADPKGVEGTFVLQTKGEFSIAADTLRIKSIANQKDLYAVERCVCYQRVTEKGLLPKEIQKEKATAIWYGESNQLKEQKKGRVYSLSTDGTQMLIGSSAYTRIED